MPHASGEDRTRSSFSAMDPTFAARTMAIGVVVWLATSVGGGAARSQIHPLLTPAPQTPMHYRVLVDVISGSRAGERYEGYFAFPAPRRGHAQVPITESAFCFGTRVYRNIGGPAVAIHGEAGLREIRATGGPRGAGFGLNLGFRRGQFRRPSETFVRQGKNYWGYLNGRSIVEGAGRVRYERLSSRPSATRCDGRRVPMP